MSKLQCVTAQTPTIPSLLLIDQPEIDLRQNVCYSQVTLTSGFQGPVDAGLSLTDPRGKEIRTEKNTVYEYTSFMTATRVDKVS